MPKSYLYRELYNGWIRLTTPELTDQSYLFMAVLGLRFCARAFSSCSKWGPLFIAVRGPLIAVASLVAEHRL